MTDDVTTVDGGKGTPVLLLAGGAASSHGFFPGLVEALSARNRVISLDRPGTGRAQRRGTATLETGSAAAARAVTQVGAGPAVVVGQSLGGALAVQFATDHPDLVAGLVLIDPTPLDLPGQVRTARRIFAVLGLPGMLPLVGPRVDRTLFRLLGSDVKPTERTAEAYEVLTTSATLAVTARAIRTLERETALLAPRVRRLGVPVVLITAERKPGHEIRASHDRLAAKLGGRVVAPPGAIHAEHMRDPGAVNELVRSVVAEAEGTSSANHGIG